jgi:SAM-dependent methyltransferase
LSWDHFEQLKQRLAAGEAGSVIAPLQELRRDWAEPALATVLADALIRCGRTEEALSCLEADIDAGIDNHWTHYCLGHHLAGLGRLAEAAVCFRRCHARQGWGASEERGYTFTHDLFSGHIATWQRWFETTIHTAPIHILEVGSWQGGATLWLLDHVIGPRGGDITCVDTWQGSSEHTFIPVLGLNVEELFDANVARSGFAEHVRKLRGPSKQILPDLPAQSFDLIYIDGAHEASIVIQDAVNAHRLLKPGGFLLFDDLNFCFEQQEENTIHAINGFCQTFGPHYEEVERGAQLLLKRRPLDQASPQVPPLMTADPAPAQGEPELLDVSTAYLARTAELITSHFDCVISGGPRCSTAWHIRRVFGRDHAYPFDWWVTPFQSTVRLLLEGKNFSIQLDDLAIIDAPNCETVLNKRWLLQHDHDFPRLDHGGIDRASLNDRTLSELNQKYQFLFQRLQQHIHEAQAPLLVIAEHLTLEQWHQQLHDLPHQLPDLVTQSQPETEPEVVVATLREFLNPRLTVLLCDQGDPACWSPSDGLIRLRSKPVKSSVDHQLADHYDWIQPLLAWDLRWQMLANHLLNQG